jgi:hypothetical protein
MINKHERMLLLTNVGDRLVLWHKCTVFDLRAIIGRQVIDAQLMQTQFHKAIDNQIDIP